MYLSFSGNSGLSTWNCFVLLSILHRVVSGCPTSGGGDNDDKLSLTTGDKPCRPAAISSRIYHEISARLRSFTHYSLLITFLQQLPQQQTPLLRQYTADRNLHLGLTYFLF